MAEEFLNSNSSQTQTEFQMKVGIPIIFEPHQEFKKRVPSAIGLIRTADIIQYANLILESA